MKKILLSLLLIQFIAALTEKKITMYSKVYSVCLQDENPPRMEIYFESVGTGFTEQIEFEFKFPDVEYIPTKCVIKKDGEETRDSKLICSMDMSIYGLYGYINIPKQPPTIQDVIFEGWNYEGKGVGICFRKHTYLFTQSENYKLSCGETSKTLEIQGKMENATQASSSAGTVLEVKSHLLADNKIEEMNCKLTFDGTKAIDNDAKLNCPFTSKAEKGGIVMSISYVQEQKYYVAIGRSPYMLDLNNCKSSWLVKSFGILLLNLLLF